MDGHDVGRERGGAAAAFALLARAGAGLTGIGIEGDLLYGPDQVRWLVRDARAGGVDARYRELRSTKGHDAFLIEWSQLTTLLGEALADALDRRARRDGAAGAEVAAGAA
jgi:homoserine O-acetyltransferase